MSATVTDRPASLNLYGTNEAPTVPTVCRNVECSVELTTRERSRFLRQNGLCEECHEDGVIVAPLPVPTTTTAATENADDTTPEPYQQCMECLRTYATAADLIRAYNAEQGDSAPAVTTAEAITFCPECMHDFAYAPATAAEAEATTSEAADVPVTADDLDVRRCGNCDTNIEALDAEKCYCSATCRLTVETKTENVSAMSVAVDVVMFALPHLTEYQAETGLRAAVTHWANGRVGGAGVKAAARAWTPDGEDYDEMAYWAQGKANTAALRVLRQAIRAAHEFNAAISK